MSDVITYSRFWMRRDTAANWASVNPILHSGEIGVVTDSSLPLAFKIGDGVTAWNSLAYTGGPFAYASGTNALTATFNPAPVLVDGARFYIEAAAANSGAATFNPNGLGPMPLRKNGNVALSANDIAGAGHRLILEYVGGSPDHFELLNPAGSSGGSITLAAVGASPNANAATLAGSTLNLEPASASFPGVVTTGAQSFAGAKTFGGTVTLTLAPVFTDAPGARLALGLGTAATQATGTSGATLPFLNGANTWATTQTFTVAPIFSDASGSRTALGATTVGGSLFTLANPGAITFIRLNADNSVSALSAASFKTALSLTSSDVSLGNVTNDTQTKAAIVPNTAPAAGEILIGNAGGTAYLKQAVSGAFTITSGGVATLATVTYAYGGTGITSYTTGDILYASGTNTLAKLAAGTDTYVLTMASGVPSWAAPSGGGATARTAGDAGTGAVAYNGTTQATGQFDGGTTAPAHTTRLNYDGNLYAKTFFGDGSGLTGVSAAGSTLIASTSLGSAGTTLTIATGSFDLAASKRLRIVFKAKNNTASDAGYVKIYMNTDTTDSNYHTQILVALGGASGAGTNDPSLLYEYANALMSAEIILSQDFDGKAEMLIQARSGTNSAPVTYADVITWNSTANPTGLKIIAPANMAVGSTAEVWTW